MTKEQEELDRLAAKIGAAEHQLDEEEHPRPHGPQPGGMGDAMRLAMDLVFAVVIGFGIGYFLDNWLGTKPWLMLIFLIFGVAAGFRNFYLFAGKLLRSNQETK